MTHAIVVTSEDRAERAEEVVHAMLRKALLADGLTLPPRRIPPDDVRRTTKAAMWRARGSKADAARVITLVRYLATQLAAGDTVVAFHFDADCAWPNQPEARADFERLRNQVAQKLPSESTDLIERLVPIVPHWCIESWTYQHTAIAAAICRELRSEASAKHFEAIPRDRASLEAARPHTDARYEILGRKYNAELATHEQFPAAALRAIGASFAAAVEALKAALETPTAPASEAR